MQPQAKAKFTNKEPRGERGSLFERGRRLDDIILIKSATTATVSATGVVNDIDSIHDYFAAKLHNLSLRRHIILIHNAIINHSVVKSHLFYAYALEVINSLTAADKELTVL